MGKCIDCGLMDRPFGKNELGHCLWFKRGVPIDKMREERDCKVFEKKIPKLEPLKQLEWKKIAKEKRTLPEANFLDAFSQIFYKHKS